jgi:hypothetical protein
MSGSVNGISSGRSAHRRACSKRGRFIDETIRGHVSCSFLAQVLKKELEDRIAAMGEAAPWASWPEILADLDSLTETANRTESVSSCARRPPAANSALRAAGRRPAADRASAPRRLTRSRQPTPNVVPRRSSSADSRCDQPLADYNCRRVTPKLHMRCACESEMQQLSGKIGIGDDSSRRGRVNLTQRVDEWFARHSGPDRSASR